MRTRLLPVLLCGCLVYLAACSDSSAPNPAADAGSDPGSDTTNNDGGDTPDAPDAPDAAPVDASDVPDAPDVPADAPDGSDAPDAPAPLQFGSVLGGEVVDFPTTAAVSGATICLDGTPPTDCVDSNEEGEFLIGGAVGGQRALARFTAPRRLINLLPWQPNTLDRPALSIPMLRPELIEAVYLDAGQQLDPGRGTFGFLIVDDAEGPRPALAGASVQVGGSETIYFRGSVPDGDVDTTDATGLAVVPNVSPGTHEFTVTAPDRTCMEGLRWESDGVFEAPAEAGALTIIYIICARHRAVPDACSLTSQCRPLPAACVSTPTATACRANVASCDDDTVCVGQILVTDCRYGQANGLDCAAVGGTCDARAGRCQVPRAGRCPSTPCAEGYVCLPSAGQVCAPGHTCLDLFGCLVGCEGDERCSEHCIGRVIPEQAVGADDMLDCMRRTRCGANFADCQAECAPEWATCRGD